LAATQCRRRISAVTSMVLLKKKINSFGISCDFGRYARKVEVDAQWRRCDINGRNEGDPNRI
jgi:hypothetical protein